MYLQSEHIVLRAVEPSDATKLMIWENDSRFWHISGTEVPFSLHAIHRYIDTAQNYRENGQLRLMICAQDKNEAIGCIDLYDMDFKNRRAGVGILIAEDVDKEKGYAFESLELLKKYVKEVIDLHQLYAIIGEENTASMRLFEKSGFEKVGTLKDWMRFKGVFSAVHLFQKIV